MSYINFDVDKNKYKLEKVFVFSRHNIRSPLSNGDSVLSKVTNHSWFDWTSKAGELSSRGYELATKKGEYFRKYLIDKGFIDDKYVPSNEEVRIYANSKQRTIKTAECFKKGMFPNSDIVVEHKELDSDDPSFSTYINFCSDKYREQVNKEIKEYFDADSLKDSFKLLEDVLDYSESKMAKQLPHLDPNDFELSFETGKEPILNGSLVIACSASDALKLQYYEDDDNYKAAFYHDLSVHEWLELCKITDAYEDLKYCMPSVSINVANPVLKQIYSELINDSRKFTFMCGHDSNIISVLAALNVNTYVLPKAFERKTPIGGAIVIEKWQDRDTLEEYYSICLQYQTVYQLEEIADLDLDLAPVKYHLTFKELETNKDGLYKANDFNNRILDSIKAHDRLTEEYK